MRSPEGAEEEQLFGAVDRIVEGMAVLLVGDEERELHVPFDSLPEGTAEGSVVKIRSTGSEIEVIAVDETETASRHRAVQARLDRLRRERSSGRFGDR